MAIIRNLIVRAGADFSELQKEMQKAQKYMKNAGKQLQSIGSTLTKAITLPILGIGAAGIKAASDLQEIQNVVDTAFGKSANEVDSWAKTTLKNFGLTELQAKQFAGSMRAMLGSMGLTAKEADNMSMKLAELAGDFASFYNLSHDEAWEKIRSGISGETEPLKQLGINMSVANLEAYALSKGIKKPFEQMSAGEQAMLRYNYLMSVTKDAQGDFSKTSDSFANQLRVVKGQFQDIAAKLAKDFLPALEGVLSKVQGALEKFKALSPEQQKSIVNFALMAAAIGPVLWLLGALSGAAANAISWIKGITKATAAYKAGTGSLGGILTAIFGPGGVVLLVVAGIAALVAGFVYLWKTNEGFRNAVINIWNNIKSAFSTTIEAIKGFFGGLVERIKQIPNDFENFKNSIQQYMQQLWQGILNILEMIKNTFITAWNWIKNTVLGLVDALITFVVDKFDWFLNGVIDIFEGLKNIFQGAWDIIKNIFLGAVLLIIDLVTGNFTKLKEDAIGIWNNLKNAFNQIWEGIKQIFIGALEIVKGYILTAWNGIKTITTTAWNGITSFLANLWSNIKNIAINTWNSILNWFAELPGRLYSIGVNMFTSMKSGVINTIGGVKSAIVNGITSAINWIKSLPSQAYNWGKDMIEGMINGIKNMIGKIKNTVNDVANSIRRILHFSVPDEGPLRDYETWMPDFISGLTAGIEKNKYKLIDAVKGMAEGMKVQANINLSNQQSIPKNGVKSGPLFVIENFNNYTENDIEKIMYQAEFYRRKAALALGGE